MEFVDRIHTEAKAFRSEHANVHEKLGERVLISEYRHDQIEKRLQEGAKSFTQIQDRIEALRDTLRPSIFKVAGAVAAAIFMVACVVVPILWKLSQYPDAEKFKEANTTAATNQKGVEEKVQALQLEQANQRSDIREIKSAVTRTEESQKRIDDKLDQVINRRRAPPD